MAGFLLGFPDNTEESIQRVREYAQSLNPTYANFNVVTPYPGTAFFQQMRPQIADTDFGHYTVYTPLLKYEHLTRGRMEQLVAKCFHRFYFRWQYLRENAPLLWPAMRRLGLGPHPAGTVPLSPAKRSPAAGRRRSAAPQGSPLRRPALAGHGPRRIGRPPRGRGGSGGIIVFIHSVTSRTITAKAGRSIRNVSEAGRRPARAPVAPKTPRS